MADALSSQIIFSAQRGAPFRDFRTGIDGLRKSGHGGDAPCPGGFEFREVRKLDAAHHGERHANERDQGFELVQAEEPDSRELFCICGEDRADIEVGTPLVLRPAYLVGIVRGYAQKVYDRSG